MAVTVYIWGFRKKEAVGHTSMLLSDGTYISWWPLDGTRGVATNTLFKRDKLATDAKAVPTIDEDIRLEEATPTEYKLKGLDEKAIQQWWDKFQGENKKWHLTNLNCSTVVYRALCAGKPELEAVDSDEDIIWTPWAIESLAKGIIANKSPKKLKEELPSILSAVNPLESVGIKMEDLGRATGGYMTAM